MTNDLAAESKAGKAGETAGVRPRTVKGHFPHAVMTPTVYALFDLWDRLLGPEAQKARAVGVRDGRLYVEVDTPVRTHGLALRKRELLKKLNAPFGGNAPLSDIIFRPGTPSRFRR
jgi:hypothetical protein